METIIKKWGNSLGLRLPNSLVKELKITDGSKVELEKKNGKIIITPNDDELTLKKLIEGMTTDGIREQMEEYPSIGNEEEI